MDTTRNRSAVLAKFLRCATATMRDVRSQSGPEYDEALASIDAVAEELETIANDLPAHSPGTDLNTSVESSTAVHEDNGRVGEREPSTSTENDQ